MKALLGSLVGGICGWHVLNGERKFGQLARSRQVIALGCSAEELSFVRKYSGAYSRSEAGRAAGLRC